VTTERGDTVFVHLLDWPDRVLALPTLGARVVRARMFPSGEPVEATQSEAGVTLTLPAGGADEPDRVVALPLAAQRKRD
jgi:alpha-L-fucosidase